MNVPSARYLARRSIREFFRRGLSTVAEHAEHSGRFEKDPDAALAYLLDSAEGKERLAEDRAVVRTILATDAGQRILAEERKALGLK